MIWITGRGVGCGVRNVIGVGDGGNVGKMIGVGVGGRVAPPLGGGTKGIDVGVGVGTERSHLML
jgi:hypothetical protein